MSIDYTTYIGPYLECKTSKVDIQTKRRTCTNKTCKNQNGVMYSNFCHDCGSCVGEITITSKANNVNKWDLYDAVHEALCCPSGDSFHAYSEKHKIDIWYGNKFRPNKNSRSFTFDPREDAQLMEFSLFTINADMLEFETQYQEGIATIENAYGKENVVCKWGLVHSIH